MIPKKIHYVWFGGKKKPELMERCIYSWQKYLPGYEIFEWNEHNFDIAQNSYAQKAFQERKWAFVSDYARLKVLSDHGGIYLDSDVEVFKSFDIFLSHKAFSGFEYYRGVYSPITAVMGSIPHHIWIDELLEDYEEAEFTFASMQTNTMRITENLINRHNIINNNRQQIFSDDVHLYPAEVFCILSKSSYSYHHFGGSWLPLKSKFAKKVRKMFKT